MLVFFIFQSTDQLSARVFHAHSKFYKSGIVFKKNEVLVYLE